MTFHKLRIAWSVAWGIVVLMLLVLWVRTNHWQDAIFRRTSQQQVLIESAYGRAILTLEYQSLPPSAITAGWRHSAGPTDIKSWPKEGILFPAGMRFGFAYIQRPGGLVAFAPYWSLVTLSVVLASLPWVRHFSYRFSLRTLLIATTLIAVVLGLIVWSAAP